MSALAQLLLAKGYKVSGSDLEENDEVKKLASLGIHINIGHRPENLPKKIHTLVYTLAIPKDNPELVEAKKRKIKIIPRTKALAELFADKIQIGIAGTHGKTTTTAMLASILLEAKLDPSFLIGGNLPGLGNARPGRGPHFIFEADEYGEQFLDFNPVAAIILNVEPDHLDYYGNTKNLKNAFRKFVSKISELGVLVVGIDVDEAIYKDFKGTLFKVGENASTKLKLKIPGKHNVFNAACAYAMSLAVGIESITAEKALSAYPGVERRFQIIRRDKRAILVDDYAHHPTEIKVTLTAAREFFPNKKIIIVFQPHQYSRTKNLLHEFAKELSNADEVILAPVYRVRDSNAAAASVTIEDLKDEIFKNNRRVKIFADYRQIADNLRNRLKNESGLVIMTMGAAPINKVWEML